MAADASERERQVGQLLRQLSVGLSAYRLYPGDVDQPGFVQAVRRIGTAAEDVIVDGPLDAGVTAGTFVVDGTPLPPDETIARLAAACYQRRVERLHIRLAPNAFDLRALYEVLAMPVEEVLSGGGATALMRRSAVVSIVLGELNPHGVEDVTLVLENLRDRREAPALRADLGLPEDAPAETPAEMAQSLFDRFHAVVGALPPEMASSLDLYRALHASVESLPDDQRRLLNAVLLDRASEDPLAERYIGTMSDTELARVLVDISERSGRDPAEMAAQLVSQRVRSDDLIELTLSLAEGRVESGTVLAGVEKSDAAAMAREDGDEQDPEDSRMVYETVGDLLGQSLLAREREDMGLLRDGFPSTEEETRESAGHAVLDYLLGELDLERLERVLASWMGATRDSMRAGDPAAVRHVVSLLERPRAEAAGEPERSMLFDVYRNQAPDPDLLRELVDRAADPDGLALVLELLAPFGEASLGALLDLLADERDGRARSLIVALATELARDHPGVVAARVGDRRVSVVRDAVTVAYRAGGAAATPILERAGRHPSPDVREEAVRGLIAVAGGSAAAQLRDLARDTDERVRTLAVSGLGGLMVPAAVQALADIAGSPGEVATRKDALDQLARHPSAEAQDRLRDLTSAKGGGRLPRPVRRYAKGLVRS